MTEAVPTPATRQPAGPGAFVPPARAEGVTLIGEMQGSGYRVAPALARRADGQTVQLTPLLYATLSALDGHRGPAEVAAAVSAATGRTVSEENTVELIDKLRPLGLATCADGSQPALERSDPLLGLRFKVAVTDPDKTRRLTAPFAALFNAVVVLPVLIAFAWICWWVLLDKGLASATHDAFARPGLLLAVLAVTVLSAGFHEFGHAAAAHRGGAEPGVMGAGLYLVWPAFYTDVTDSYRLGRAGRLRTDLGGLYFNAIVAVATVITWWATSHDALLLLVATQILQMLRQLLPFVRFDGYHVLADLTGVPDLFQRIGPTLRGLIPWRESDPEAQALKPWARGVVTLWVLTVVPVLLGVMILMVVALPRLVGTAWASARAQQDQLAVAVGEGDLVGGVARALSMVIVVLPIVAFGYILVRLARQVGGRVWRHTRGRPGHRALAILAALAVLAGLAWAWWPSESRYRPVQAYEGGTLTDILPVSAPRAGLAVGSEGRGTVVWPANADLPTRNDPQLAAVLVPVDDAGAPATAGSAAGSAAPPEQAPTAGGSPAGSGTWIFPFDEPLAPDLGDNQALAVNTTDDTVTYAVAFALIWADGEDPADNTNEAYALASCDNCAAVAVAFQVVLVVGEADVAVPQNIAVAVNYDCTSCLTYSLAVQLFVTLDGPLSDEATAAIEKLWEDIMEYGLSIGQVPLDEMQAQLTVFEEQIIEIIEADQGPLTGPDESTQTTPDSGTTPSTPSAPSTSPAQTGTTVPEETASSSGEPSATTTPAPTETAEPVTSPTPSSTPTTTAPAESPAATSGPSPSSSVEP